MPPPLPFRFRLGTQECLIVSPRDIFEPRDREAAERLVRDSGVDPEHAEAMVEALLAGSHVAVRIDSPIRVLDGPNVRPLIDPAEPIDDDPRPTWISVQVVHSAGISTEGLDVHLVTAEGRARYGRLDAEGHWRCETVTRGTCTFTLVEQAALRVRPRLVELGVTGVSEVRWEVGKTEELELAAAAHHRIRVTNPRSLRFSV